MKNKKQENNLIIVPQEIIKQKIFLIRGKKVMIDRDLAVLYGVETFNLNKAVKRNKDRFPEDFMFQLSKDEFQNLIFHSGISRSQAASLKSSKSQFVTSSWGGTRKLPYAFTEPGVAMLSSVLRSKKAVQVNIQIIRTFIKIRELIISNKELRAKIEILEKKYDGKFRIVFDAINKILTTTKEDIYKIKKIGFRDRGK